MGTVAELAKVQQPTGIRLNSCEFSYQRRCRI